MTTSVHYVSFAPGAGYSAAARRLMLALVDAGIDLTWTPVVGRTPEGDPRVHTRAAHGDPALAPFLLRSLDTDTLLLHTLPGLMPDWLDRKGTRRVVGYTVWETDVLPPRWVTILNRLDHLLVPCTWNRDVFRRHGVRVPITVLPHLPGPARPAPHPRWAAIPGGELVFHCVETWTTRKNLEQTVTLFRRCFSASDGVRLIVKTIRWPEAGSGDPDRPGLHLLRSLSRRLPGRMARALTPLLRADAHARLRHIERLTPGGAPVDLITDELTRAELEGLHHRGDCYLSLTHGEGWGLGPFDAAAAGKPVIITGFGGVRDYLDAAQGTLVDWDPAPAWGRAGIGNWAEPRLDHAASLLRAFRADPDTARRRSMDARDGLQARFGAAALIPGLKEILAGAKSAPAGGTSTSTGPGRTAEPASGGDDGTVARDGSSACRP